MLTIQQRYFSGLGNQLFILAGGESFAHQTGRQFYIHDHHSPYSPHSGHNYYDRILKGWRQFYRPMTATITIDEPLEITGYIDWPEILDKNETQDIEIHGYFQHWRYVEPIREQFANRLFFNKDIVKKYPDISQRFFLHVRGGDYLTWAGFVDLKNYYRKCLNRVQRNKIAVFTNDESYTKQLLDGFDYDVIRENEEDSLYLMTQCRGGICANSSYSWWGAYLNPNRPIFIPSKWNIDIEAYSFPGVTIVDV